MESTAKRSIVLILISLIISFLVYMCTNLGINSFFHLFVYFLSLLVLPDWLRNNKINWRMKLLLTIFVGIISITTLIHIFGIGKILYRYTIIFCIAIICFIIIDTINAKKNVKD